MKLTAEIKASNHSLIKLSEKEILAIKAWLEFSKIQSKSNEGEKIRNGEYDDISEENLEVEVDPFKEMSWLTLLRGFLAAHNIIGWRNYEISSHVYYNEDEINFTKEEETSNP